MDGYLGEIRLFPFSWAPNDWLPCDGRTLNIRQYQALYSLLGTTYGGDGTATFALPDLQGRVAVGTDSNPARGTKSGAEKVAVPAQILPEHNHTVGISLAGSGNTAPEYGLPAVCRNGSGVAASKTYVKASTDRAVIINPATVASTPGAPVDNMQPSLVLTYCICVANALYPPHS
ncbi:phage tail protein [Pseudomonas sichuanensis]|uniref:phage tail protein n=1 Tax=Pseudomonas TaxID=286 RepID=UPI0037F20A3E